jgi:hypothetical protein
MPSVSSPAGLTKHNASTIFLRVPREDWAAVSIGAKTEFRMPGFVAWTRQIKTPTPVLAYAANRGGFRDSRLMLLERVWTMPVGMIEEESLQREGFPDLAHFRRYWMKRTKKRFNMMQTVQVFRVRPVDSSDYDYLGRILLSRLYGEYV